MEMVVFAMLDTTFFELCRRGKGERNHVEKAEKNVREEV